MRSMARYADDEPVPLADALAAVGSELGLPPGNAHGDLDAHWPEVVGADVAGPRTARCRCATACSRSPSTTPSGQPSCATSRPRSSSAATAVVGPGLVTALRVRVG